MGTDGKFYYFVAILYGNPPFHFSATAPAAGTHNSIQRGGASGGTHNSTQRGGAASGRQQKGVKRNSSNKQSGAFNSKTTAAPRNKVIKKTSVNDNVVHGGDGENEVTCNCKQPALKLTVKKDGPNQGESISFIVLSLAFYFIYTVELL